jgi:hypothetical protein
MKSNKVEVDVSKKVMTLVRCQVSEPLIQKKAFPNQKIYIMGML